MPPRVIHGEIEVGPRLIDGETKLVRDEGRTETCKDILAHSRLHPGPLARPCSKSRYPGARLQPSHLCIPNSPGRDKMTRKICSPRLHFFRSFL